MLQSGEGVPSSRKGICANHVRDVENLFKVRLRWMGLGFEVLIQEDMKMILFANVNTKEAPSPQQYKEPKCWPSQAKV